LTYFIREPLYFVGLLRGKNATLSASPVVVWGVSISKPEKCTLSKIGGRADLLMWLHKRIEEKSFEVRKADALVQSSQVSIVSRTLI
jgi:hypothetical protein